MASNTQKTIAGALLLGAGILSGNAVLLTAAGGVGVNWASEGLAGLWQGAERAFAPGTPLARAGERAIRQAVADLRREYRKVHGRQASTEAFDLVSACAEAVAVAEFPSAKQEPLAAQQALAPALHDLLHGHEERQVAFLKRRLLGAVTEAFRDELAADPEAWARYHGWMIERIAAQSDALSGALVHVPEVLARLSDQAQALRALDDAADALQAQLAELRVALDRIAAGSAPGGTTFSNRNVKVGGNLNQAGGNIYDRSAHVEGGGFAIVINNPSPPTPASAGGPTVRNIQRQALEQQIKDLAEEYAAVSRQLTAVLGAAEQKRLQRQLDALQQQLADAEAALRRLDGPASS